MLKIRPIFIVLGMLLYPVASPAVQVSIGIGLPNVSIGINLPAYPDLVVVPGSPVYYAPRLDANFFFYDGMYWIYQQDNWYESSWYNGPWWFVDPQEVPVFVLRIPVRYYRQPPMYFVGWRADAPPRWGDHWGHDWEQRRSGWDRWNRSAAPAPAPLPLYQRQYSGDRYPRQVQQQHELQTQNYRYQSRDPIVQQHYQQQSVRRTPVQQGNSPQEKRGTPDEKGRKQQDMQQSMPRQQEAPNATRLPSMQRGGVDLQRPTPASPQQGRPEVQDRRQPLQPEPAQREQQTPRSQGQDERQQGRDATSEPKREQGRERKPDRNE